MPVAPPRSCPFCGAAGCTTHTREAWRRLNTPPPRRLRGRALQTARARLFAVMPWCATCYAAGRKTRATVRDHVIPLSEGGTDTDGNTQGLCQPCSDAKTRAEAARGLRRARL